MTTWSEFARDHPTIAAAVLARLTAHKHHVLATVRADGSPRVSGTEVTLVGDDLLLGSMTPSVKVSDLLRDPRFALHSNPGEETMDGGDAKLSGVAEHISDPELARAITDDLQAPEPNEWFRLDLRQVVLTSVDMAANRMIVQSWTPVGGVRQWTREGSGPAVPVG